MQLEFKESPITVRVGETLNWSFAITPWAASGSSPSVSAVRTDTGADVTSLILSGTATIVGTTYTLPVAAGWIVNVEYRITCQFASGGNILRPFFIVQVVA